MCGRSLLSRNRDCDPGGGADIVVHRDLRRVRIAESGTFLYFVHSNHETVTFAAISHETGGFRVNGQMMLLVVLSASAVALVAVVAVTVWRLLNTMERLAEQVEQTFKHFEGLAQDIRGTNEEVRKIMNHLEKSASNVEHMTEGVRGFRTTLDAASSVLQFAVVPVLGTLAGGLAGVKASVSHVAKRVFRKEGHHG